MNTRNVVSIRRAKHPTNNVIASGNSPTHSGKILPDFVVENYGSIFLFRMNTPAAAEWVSHNVQEDAQFFGDALVVEHRYAADLAEGIHEEGLVLS